MITDLIKTNQSKTEVIRILSKWQDSQDLLPKDQAEANSMQAEIDFVSKPSDHTWLMARIGSLLHPYYAGKASSSAIDMMAEDWSEALGGFPEWAVTNAVRWWKSANNPNRHRKPLEGDIAERCNAEMGAVRAAEIAIRRFNRGVRHQSLSEEARYSPSPEDLARRRAAASQIMSEVFGSKRIGEE